MLMYCMLLDAPSSRQYVAPSEQSHMLARLLAEQAPQQRADKHCHTLARLHRNTAAAHRRKTAAATPSPASRPDRNTPSPGYAMQRMLRQAVLPSYVKTETVQPATADVPPHRHRYPPRAPTPSPLCATPTPTCCKHPNQSKGRPQINTTAQPPQQTFKSSMVFIVSVLCGAVDTCSMLSTAMRFWRSLIYPLVSGSWTRMES